MEKAFAKAEELAEHVREYFNNRIASTKLSTAEKSSEVIANIIARTIVAMVFVFFILFASIALAQFFGKITGENYWGYLIVSGIYLVIGFLVWALKEKILRLPIMNSILQKLSKEEDDEN